MIAEKPASNKQRAVAEILDKKQAQPEAVDADDDDEPYIPSEMEKRIDAMTEEQWKRWQMLGGGVIGAVVVAALFLLGQELSTYSLILAAVTLVYVGAFVVLVLTAEGTSDQMAGTILSVALIAISYLVMLGLAIAITVFCFIAYYDLFRSCKPKHDVLFLVLGILFNVTLPFFVFACSGADEGMPARRAQQPPAYMPPQPEEPTAPAWEEEIPTVEAEVVEDPEM